MSDPHTKRQGFTLMELLITAAILLALAGMAIPVFSTTVEEAQQTTASQMLARVRTAIDFYAFQHDEELPGYDLGTGTWSTSAFENHLRMASDGLGNTAAVGTAGYPFGPYLTEAFPANPYNDLSSVTLVPPGGTFLGPDDATGWVFFADTGIIRANSTGTTYAGGAIFDL